MSLFLWEVSLLYVFPFPFSSHFLPLSFFCFVLFFFLIFILQFISAPSTATLNIIGCVCSPLIGLPLLCFCFPLSLADYLVEFPSGWYSSLSHSFFSSWQVLEVQQKRKRTLHSTTSTVRALTVRLQRSQQCQEDLRFSLMQSKSRTVAKTNPGSLEIHRE